MQKQARGSLASELFKTLYKLPGSLYKGTTKAIGATDIGPYLKALGQGTAGAVGGAFQRNPIIMSGLGLGGIGALSHLLLNKDQPPGYYDSIGSFIGKAQEGMKDAYPGSLQANPLYWAGKGSREFIANPVLKPLIGSLSSGPLTSATLGALGGSGIGGLLGLVRGGLGDVIPGMLTGAGVGGLGLGGLSALLHKNSSPTGLLSGGLPSWGFDRSYENPFTSHSTFMKSSSVKKAQFGSGTRMPPGQVVPTSGDVVSNIYQQPSAILSLRQKQELSNQVSLLTPYQQDRLSQLLRGATGAGIAYIVAKYLLSLGKRSTIISVILGGIAGAMSGGNSGGPARTRSGLMFNPRGY